MKDDIVKKLNIFLSKVEEFNECTVVYFFTEIRKIIEHLCEGLPRDEQKKIHPIVKFYADWCLHIKKDNTDDLRNYIENIATGIERSKNMSLAAFISSPSPQRHALAPLIESEELKSKLAIFLTENDIVASFLEENDKWFSFRNSLGKILADQPLIFKNPVGNLRIKEISFLATNPSIPCAFLVSIKDVNNKELGPFIFADDKVNASF